MKKDKGNYSSPESTLLKVMLLTSIILHLGMIVAIAIKLPQMIVLSASGILFVISTAFGFYSYNKSRANDSTDFRAILQRSKPAELKRPEGSS